MFHATSDGVSAELAFAERKLIGALLPSPHRYSDATSLSFAAAITSGRELQQAPKSVDLSGRREARARASIQGKGRANGELRGGLSGPCGDTGDERDVASCTPRGGKRGFALQSGQARTTGSAAQSIRR